MVSYPIEPTYRRLPVWAVVTRSYSYVWEHRALFATPIAILFVITFALNYLGFHNASPSPAAKFLSGIARLALEIMVMAFVVGVHRTVLLDENRHGAAFFRRDRNLWRYLWTSVLLVLIFVAIYIVAIMMGVLLAVAGATSVKLGGNAGVIWLIVILLIVAISAAIFILILRLELALPAAALGEQKRFTLSWRATKGNVTRLFAISLLTYLPFLFVTLVVLLPFFGDMHAARLAHQPIAPHLGLFATTCIASASAIAVPILTTMLSLNYDILVRGNGPTERPQTI